MASSSAIKPGHVAPPKPGDRLKATNDQGAPSLFQGRQHWQEVKSRLVRSLMRSLDAAETLGKSPDEVQALIAVAFDQALERTHTVLPRTERQTIFDAVLSEIAGYGPLDSLLKDESITDIMVNGPHQVWIERNGLLAETDLRFEDDAHVRLIIERIISPLGRHIDENSPMVDARLPDGSRVNAIIPPLSLVGPVLTIRKFRKEPLRPRDLVNYGTVTPEALHFLSACVRARVNMIVSGGTGSGKTTFLNVLSQYIGDEERIITVEDAAELRLQQDHVVRLEKRPANTDGRGEVSIRDLVVNALRMRPTRIVVGEVRGPEALDMLQAMTTGHDGSMTTVHSNSPRDTLSRVETMVIMSGVELPLTAIREQVASAVRLIVHVARLMDGSRRLVAVSEIVSVAERHITLQEIFVFRQTDVVDGKVIGRLEPTGVLPRVLDRIARAGIAVDRRVFEPTADALDGALAEEKAS